MTMPKIREKVATEPKSTEPRLLVCRLPGDLATARLVRSFSDRQGAVVIDTLGSSKSQAVRASDLGAAVLRAIGKSEHVNALKRKTDPLALAWLCALEPAADGGRPLMVVCEAQQLGEAALSALRSWSAVAGLDLCLLLADSASTDGPVCDAPASKAEDGEAADWEAEGWMNVAWEPLRDTLAARLKRGTANRVSVNRVPVNHVSANDTTAERPAGPGFRVPRVDGLIFRSTCRDVLGAEDFSQVDEIFVSWVCSFRRSFAECGELTETARYATVIRAAIESAPSTEELIIRVRAAQVAALGFGLVLGVDTIRLLAAAESLCRRGLAGPQRWWEELDRYCDPDPGALAALYHAHLDLGDAVDLRLSDVHVTADGATVTVCVGDREVAVDPEASRFLVVQRQYRLLCGAEICDPLFATFRRPGMTKECAVNQLRLATAELGVDIIKGVLSTYHHNTPAYLARYGIRLAKALKAPNSPRDPTKPVRQHRRKSEEKTQ